MPGTSIGAKLPSPDELIFGAHIKIEKRDGKYTQTWHYEGNEDIAKGMEEFLERTIKELSGE